MVNIADLFHQFIVITVSRSSSTPAFHNYSTPHKGNTTNMSLSADSTPSPRLVQPTARPSAIHTSRLQGKMEGKWKTICMVTDVHSAATM